MNYIEELKEFMKLSSELFGKMDVNERAREIEAIKAKIVEKDAELPLIGFIMNEENHTYKAYLVNPTGKGYHRVLKLTGGFSGDDDGLLETSKSAAEMGPLMPRSSLLIEESDWDELDFVVWFHFDLFRPKIDKPVMVWGQLPKYGLGYEGKLSDLPVLDVTGMRIDLEPRTDGRPIEESVKELNMESRFYPSEDDELAMKKVPEDKYPTVAAIQENDPERYKKMIEGLSEGQKGIEEQIWWQLESDFYHDSHH